MPFAPRIACGLLCLAGIVLASCGPPLPPGLQYLSGDQDPRRTDPDYAWVQKIGETSHCNKCHSPSLAAFPKSVDKAIKIFNLDVKPTFFDSASDENLKKLTLTQDEGGRLFPAEDLQRFKKLVERELARRQQQRAQSQ